MKTSQDTANIVTNKEKYALNEIKNQFKFKQQARILTATDYKPDSTASALTIINDNKRDIVTLLFYDAQTMNTKLKDASKGGQDTPGFWGNLMGGIRDMFTTTERSVADLVNEMSKDSVLIEIDSSNPDLKSMQEIYNVPSIPYIIVLQGNKVLYRGIPDDKTYKKISQILKPIEEIDYTNHEAYPVTENIVPDNETENENNEENDNNDENVNDENNFDPEQYEFMPLDSDSPFYFGDNYPTYDESLYKDPMNGGLIQKSDRMYSVPVDYPYNQWDSRLVGITNETESQPEEIEIPMPVKMQEVSSEPPPKIIEINRATIQPASSSLPEPEEETIVIDEVVEAEPEIVEEPVPEIEEEPEPEPEEEPEPEVVEEPEPEPTPEPEPKPEPEVKIIERVIEKCPNPPEPPPAPEPEIKYIEKVVEKCPNPPEPEVVEVVKEVPVPYPVYESPEPKPKKHMKPTVIDKNWDKVIKDEEIVEEEIRKIKEIDTSLAKTLQSSEEDLHESEELYNKAKNAIEMSLAESERQMKIYEQKLDELYRARLEAMKARDILLHPPG